MLRADPAQQQTLCRRCLESGLHSTVGHGPVWHTLMADQRFTDAEGREHNHDPNTFGAKHWCSMGHRWYARWLKPCWCGYNEGAEPYGSAYEELTDDAGLYGSRHDRGSQQAREGGTADS